MADDRKKSEEQPIDQSSSFTQNTEGVKKKADSDDEKVGWIDSLAQRSTGLPEYTKQPVEKSDTEKSPWRYAGLGLQFAGTTGLFVFMGYELDKRMGWTPWGLVSLGMLGLIGGLYLLIKDVMKENADGPAGPEPPAKK